jgi:hypothetical protein
MGYFFSHTSEDKKVFVEPLARRLRDLAVRVWYDRFVLVPGDRLSEKIGEGLAKSRSGLLVISKVFLTKPWGRYELSGLVNRFVEENIPLIPIWVDVSRADVAAKNPAIADLLSIKADPTEIELCALEILRVVRPQLHENLSMLGAIDSKKIKIVKLKRSKIKEGPIRHHDLPSELLVRMQNIWFELKDIYKISLAKFIERFQRDLRPEREVGIFERLVGAMKITFELLKNRTRYRKDVFRVLLGFSMGNHEQIFDETERGKIPKPIPNASARAWLKVVPQVTVSDVDDTGRP